MPRREFDDAAGGGALPRTLAHFRLLALIGEGGFGRVYQAWDVRLERFVALKVMHRATTDGAERALREARLAAQVDHPAFVRVHECVDTVEGPAIAMALVRGRTFAGIIGDGAMAPPAALQLVRQLADALAAAHAQHVVHGDIKPSNLMRGDGGEARILDLGLARRDGQLTQSNEDAAIAGTIAYLAPEQLFGRRATPASDIYALGVVLHELVDGAPPHGALRGGALAHAVLHGAAASPPRGVGDGLAELIAAMTARDASRRPASMNEVVARIDRLLAPPREIGFGFDEPLHRHGYWFAGIALAIVGVAVAAIVQLVPYAHRSTARTPAGAAVATPAPRAPPPTSALATIATPDDTGVVATIARLRDFERPGVVDAAIARFEAMLARAPRHAAANAGLALALCLRYTGVDPDRTWLARARAAADIARAADDQLALAHVAVAWVEDLAGDDAAADEAYQRALRLAPGDFFALQGYIRLLTRERRFERAESLLDDAHRRHPRERVFADALGTLRFRQGDYARAAAAFRDAIALKPESPYAYANLTATLLRQGDPEAALTVLQEGLAVRPHARLYSNLGTVLFAQGRYVDAAAAFERALHGPDGAPQDPLKWANYGDALRQIPGRDADARAAFARARELHAARLDDDGARDATATTRLALYAAKAGDAAGARLAIDAARALSPDADGRFRLAVAAELSGDRTRALDELRAALAAGYPRRLVDGEPELVHLRRDARYPHLTPQEFARP